MKRCFDILGAGVALVSLLPVMAIVALVVRRVLGRPILYRTRRAGRAEFPFTLLKFRTMSDERDADGRLLPDAQRLGPVGAMLRATSLDELPQLWNVIRGDMSLVGPRPLPTRYGPRYTEEERRRHSVRPGMTGWAQIHGRNELDWDRRLALDVWYVDNQSLWLDLKILARTVTTVLRRGGITAKGHASMPDLRPDLAGEPE